MLGLAGVWWPRRLSWSGTLPPTAVAKRRPGSSTLPGRQTEPTPVLSLVPDRALLARVLAGLRAL
ncbi:hypothetical protein CEP50_11440 [Actinopolyspora mortivallis]|uniref:Uncharacterized protein n=1 Tax=Actinopolyspora mortivallis TaxID=33906 RepID=A0A2T0GVM8_ACTMO|nr:hypothetical protein CEP50_11440 [Actinopolyspora mortivallis]